MRISIVQSSLVWESPAENLDRFSQKLKPLAGKTDLVVLPEMFTTGFSMNAEALAETMQGSTVDWLLAQAGQLGAAVMGSFICLEETKFHNRLVFARPDGSYEHYDKKHLFTLGQEGAHYVPGKKRLTVEWQGWQICPLVCYDLRFPVWSRNTTGTFLSGHIPLYDLLIYVANWPSGRVAHWNKLLPARAIENQAFAVGVNIVGTDGKGLQYSGGSAAYDFGGQALAAAPDHEEVVMTVELSLNELHDYRRQLPFLADADSFEFK
jgi:Predicted amidohydrolase